MPRPINIAGTCNGCWHLGEACGHCSVCAEPAPFRTSWSHERIRSADDSRFLGWGVLFALIAVGFAHWGVL
jgi:hypothetical protein